MRAVLAVVVLLVGCAPVAGLAEPAKFPAGEQVIAVRDGRLITVFVQGEPPSTGGGDEAWPPWTLQISDADGELEIVARFDCGSAQVGFRLEQEPSGHIEIEVEILNTSGFLIATRAYCAERYIDIANARLITGDRLTDILAVISDGFPPVDYDLLRAKLSMTTEPVQDDTRGLIELLDFPSPWDREAAARLLAREEKLPQLRTALASEDLSPTQKMQVEAILRPPAAGRALLAAAGGK